MTTDQYVASVIRKYAVGTGNSSPAYRAAVAVIPLLRQWAGPSLLNIGLSGSYAKGTAISLGTDIDIFVSLDDIHGLSMKDIYWKLFQFLVDQKLQPQVQNVSIRIQRDGVKIDVVPGRKQKGNTSDHTLYHRKRDSWMQTNVDEHIRLVAGSGCADEIRALKIWRQRNYLDFPSFYLELTTIDALRGNRSQSLAERVWSVLQYLANRFKTARVVDPANSNNVVSDDLGPYEKRLIAVAAQKSIMMRSWEQILW